MNFLTGPIVSHSGAFFFVMVGLGCHAFLAADDLILDPSRRREAAPQSSSASRRTAGAGATRRPAANGIAAESNLMLRCLRRPRLPCARYARQREPTWRNMVFRKDLGWPRRTSHCVICQQALALEHLNKR